MSNPNDPQDPQQAPPAPPNAPPAAPPQYSAPPQQYATPQHPQYAAQQQYAPAPPTNMLAIFAFISAFILPFVVPVILGHISLKQIKRSGEGGRGLALAGLIIGYVEIGLWVIFAIFFIFIFAILGAGVALDPSYY